MIVRKTNLWHIITNNFFNTIRNNIKIMHEYHFRLSILIILVHNYDSILYMFSIFYYYKKNIITMFQKSLKKIVCLRNLRNQKKYMLNAQ
jgi:hypothetical protein